MKVDYSLYLVTDSTPAILGHKDICNVVEEAIEGGVTIVQYRDKHSDTAVLVKTATRLHEITRRHGVPLLINDRVDVALAVGVEGVHIGQEDMSVKTARQLLGANAIIGVTASDFKEAESAIYAGASYLGLGTVYTTSTKKNTKSIIGTNGVREILQLLSDASLNVPLVAIGGLNISNASRVLSQTRTEEKSLDGLAIVSAIMAAESPKDSARTLLQKIVHETCKRASVPTKHVSLEAIPHILQKLVSKQPLCHNMTNLVVQNFAANVAICIGASPIMANYGEEAADLAKLGGALVVNMGTVTPDGIANYSKAIQAYNHAERPILFDPVGGGATTIRKAAVKSLMNSGYFTAIKGNVSEIAAVLGQKTIQQKGVDAGSIDIDDVSRAAMAKDLAAREGNVVIITGKKDYLSDGKRTVCISNGHDYLGHITGSGCTLGTTIAAFLAVHPEDYLLAATAGLLMFEIAAELAAARADVQGPGTFVPAFLDELHAIAKDSKRDQYKWLSRAQMHVVDH